MVEKSKTSAAMAAMAAMESQKNGTRPHHLGSCDTQFSPSRGGHPRSWRIRPWVKIFDDFPKNPAAWLLHTVELYYQYIGYIMVNDGWWLSSSFNLLWSMLTCCSPGQSPANASRVVSRTAPLCPTEKNAVLLLNPWPQAVFGSDLSALSKTPKLRRLMGKWLLYIR